MNNLAYTVKVVKTHQALLRHDPAQRQRDSLVVVSLDDLKKVDSENLKNHYKVLAMSPVVQEAVEKLH